MPICDKNNGPEDIELLIKEKEGGETTLRGYRHLLSGLSLRSR